MNVTNVVDLPSGILSTFENSLQHDIGIHDFYRYGLWGFCEGDNDTVVSCTPPKPGNATNPIASINNELKYDLHLPLPSKVQTDVNELEYASLFIFACWIIGPVFGFGAVVAGGLVGCSSRLASWVVGTTASVFLFIEANPDLCADFVLVLLARLRSFSSPVLRLADSVERSEL